MQSCEKLPKEYINYINKNRLIALTNGLPN